MRSTVYVVTPEDVVDRTVIHQHLNLTVDLGVSTAVTKTATIDGTVDDTFLQPYLRDLAIGIVYVTLCRTTIDVAIDSRRGGSNVTDGNGNIISSTGFRTVSSTKDTVCIRGVSSYRSAVDIDVDGLAHCSAGIAATVDTGAHRATVDIHYRGACHTGCLTAAVDVGQGTVGQGHCRVANGWSLATTTVNAFVHFGRGQGAVDGHLWVTSNGC